MGTTAVLALVIGNIKATMQAVIVAFLIGKIPAIKGCFYEEVEIGLTLVEGLFPYGNKMS